jgi:hypothetical protein
MFVNVFHGTPPVTAIEAMKKVPDTFLISFS